MRPVNLLPEKLRPRGASGGGQGTAYIALGVLGALVVAVLLYVVTANQASSRTAEAAQAQEEAKQAESQSVALGAFGNFAAIKQTRTASVRGLAQARFDWERLVREISRVLPSNVWITTLSASATPEETTGPTANAPQGPSLRLTGCASSQPEVAATVLRLRRLHRAQEVKLQDSTRSETEGGAGAPAGAPAGGTASCSGYQFNATVNFTTAPPASPAPVKVPASLGGGS